MHHLPSLLRRLRERSGLSQDQVSAALGRTRSLVSHWETGRHAPSVEDLTRILDLFNADDGDRAEALTLPAEPEAPAA